MAITTTNARYEGFIFDGENSRDYGVYVTDVEVFGAPVRNVEMVTIPGRNGAFALDKGSYENIEVKYKCVMGCKTPADFNAGISAFRNMLASRTGYKRLEDEINTSEYRMACFRGGISVPTLNKETGTFEVTFDCKPQRFLKSGEIPRTIGGAVTNPQTKSGAVVSIDSDGGDKATSLIATIEAVQAGSGDPSPTNVRAITGWTEAKVFDTGKNLVDESTAIGFNAAVTVDGGYISVTKNASSNYPAAHINTYLRAGVTYTVSATCVQATAQAKLAIRNIAPSSTTVAMMTGYFTDGQRKSVTYTPTKSGMYRVALFSCFGTADTGTAIFTDVQCEIGNTATAYEPYTGTTTTTALGRTVYGGTVDVVTGTLTLTHKAEIFDGTESWGSEQTSGGLTNYYLNLDVAGKMAGKQGGLLDDGLLCNWLAPSSAITTYSVYVGSTSKFLNCKCSSASDVAAFKSMLSTTPLVVVYPLETQQTYALTGQEVSLLAGQNNVWADTGDISITYGHDPNKLVNPTLFESHPLLQVWGYGGITFPDGRYANIVSEEIGWVLLANSVSSFYDAFSEIENSNYKLMRSGGEIRLNRGSSVAFYVNSRNSAAFEITNFEAHFTASQIPNVFIGWSGDSTSKTIDVIVPEVSTTLESYYTKTVLIEATVGYRNITDGTTGTYTANFMVKLEYKHHPANGDVFSILGNIVSSGDVGFLCSVGTAKLSDIYGYSSARPTDDEWLYLDTDIGEAYVSENGEVSSINNVVEFSAQLPTLKSGENTITYDNTITQFKIVPRWWEV